MSCSRPRDPILLIPSFNTGRGKRTGEEKNANEKFCRRVVHFYVGRFGKRVSADGNFRERNRKLYETKSVYLPPTGLSARSLPREIIAIISV